MSREFLNDIAPGWTGGSNYSYVQKFDGDLLSKFNIPIIEEGVVNNYDGTTTPDMRNGIFRLDFVDRPPVSGVESSLIIAPPRGYHATGSYSRRIYVLDDSYGDPVKYSFGGDSDDGKIEGAGYAGIFPLAESTLYLRLSYKLTDVIGTGKLEVILEGYDPSGTYSVSEEESPWKVVRTDVESSTSDMGYWSQSITSFNAQPATYSLYRISFRVTSCIAHLGAISLSSSMNAGLIFNEPRRTILEMLYESDETPAFTVSQRRNFLTPSLAPGSWEPVYKGTIDNSFSLKTDCAGREVGGVWGKELSFVVHHSWKYPLTQLFGDFAEIKVEVTLAGVVLELFRGFVVKEEVDRLYYSTTVKARDLVSLWREFLDKFDANVTIAGAPPVLPKMSEGILGGTSAQTADYYYRGWLARYITDNYKGDWYYDRLSGTPPTGIVKNASNVEVYEGDKISVGHGGAVKVYHYKFQDDYISPSSSVVRFTSFDGKTYTGSALKEYIKSMTPTQILAKAGGSNVIELVETFAGNWERGVTREQNDIIQYGTSDDYIKYYKYLLGASSGTGVIAVHKVYYRDELPYVAWFRSTSTLLNTYDGASLLKQVPNGTGEWDSKDPYVYLERYGGLWNSTTEYYPNVIVSYQGYLYRYIYPRFSQNDVTIVRNSDLSIEYEWKSVDTATDLPRGYTLPYNGQTTVTIAGKTATLTSIYLGGVLKGQTPEQILTRQGSYKYIEKLGPATATVGEVLVDGGYTVISGRLYKIDLNHDSLDLGRSVARNTVNEFIRDIPPDRIYNSSTGASILRQISVSNLNNIPYTISRWNLTDSASYPRSEGVFYYSGSWYRYKKELKESEIFITSLDEKLKLASKFDPTWTDLYSPPIVTLGYVLYRMLKDMGVDLPNEWYYSIPNFIAAGSPVCYRELSGSLGEVLESICEIGMLYIDASLGGDCTMALSNGGSVSVNNDYGWSIVDMPIDPPEELLIRPFIDEDNISLESDEETGYSGIVGKDGKLLAGSEGRLLNLSSNIFVEFMQGTYERGLYIDNSATGGLMDGLMSLLNLSNSFKRGSVALKAYLPIMPGDLLTSIIHNGLYLTHFHARSIDSSGIALSENEISFN